jgi:glycosyltransferase involved in cell wall biosynthesis
LRLSIIIANYNYAEFVGAAIASALAVDWPDKEVIVVDDASTDDSRQVIEAFGSRIRAYFKSRCYQFGAHKLGFKKSTGDVVIFLDSDDVLEPMVMREVAVIWRPSVSKVQFRMNLIAADGVFLGTAIPQFPRRDDPVRLRRSYLRTMAYTTPPGSGNAYSRACAREAFAAAPSTMRTSDDPLLTLAPLLGDVLTIRMPLARYRVHGRNACALDVLDTDKVRARLHQDVEKARLFASVCAQRGLKVPRDLLARSPHHLQYRLASYLIEPAAHPFPQDRFWRLLSSLASSLAVSPQMRWRDKSILLAWSIACALAPAAQRRRLVLWRFSPMERPAIVKRLLGWFSSLQSAALPAGSL